MEPQPYPPAEGEGEGRAQQQRPRGRRGLAALVTATALVVGASGVGIGYAVSRGVGGDNSTAGGDQDVPVPGDPFGQGGSDSGQGQSAEDTKQKASASQITGLVRIVSTSEYSGSKGVGTGMVLSSTGQVVTNHHVVEGSTGLEVTVMSTGRTYGATVVGTDAKDDVAVLLLTGASGLDTVSPDTDGATVGERVTAVGDAKGTANHLSAASGKVTALEQSITARNQGTADSERLTGLVEISSDVISGDSGGATYDEDGEVIGMTTAASIGGDDIDGYAVPIDKVLAIVDDLDSGVVSSRYDYDRPAFLGVGLTENGATVAGVYEDTPAAEAGIEAGDRITAIGSTEVSTSAQLQAAVARLDPGDQVSVTWTGDGGSETTSVTLATGAVE